MTSSEVPDPIRIPEFTTIVCRWATRYLSNKPKMGIQDHQHHREKQDQTPHKPDLSHRNRNLPPQKYTQNYTQKASSHRHQTTALHATPPYPSVIPTNTLSPALHRLIRLWFRFGKEAPTEVQLSTNQWTFETCWYQDRSVYTHCTATI